jgi:hypothetical protein
MRTSLVGVAHSAKVALSQPQLIIEPLNGSQQEATTGAIDKA